MQQPLPPAGQHQLGDQDRDASGRASRRRARRSVPAADHASGGRGAGSSTSRGGATPAGRERRLHLAAPSCRLIRAPSSSASGPSSCSRCTAITRGDERHGEAAARGRSCACAPPSATSTVGGSSPPGAKAPAAARLRVQPLVVAADRRAAANGQRQGEDARSRRPRANLATTIIASAKAVIAAPDGVDRQPPPVAPRSLPRASGRPCRPGSREGQERADGEQRDQPVGDAAERRSAERPRSGSGIRCRPRTRAAGRRARTGAAESRRRPPAGTAAESRRSWCWRTGRARPAGWPWRVSRQRRARRPPRRAAKARSDTRAGSGPSPSDRRPWPAPRPRPAAGRA